MRRSLPVLGLAVLGLATPPGRLSAADLTPPVARKDPRTVKLHGDTLVDDYHWLRNKGTPEVEAYLKAELAYAEAFMRPTEALQQKLYDEMLSRIQQTDINVPYRGPRVLLLLAHGGGEAVPDLLPQEGLASTRRRR